MAVMLAIPIGIFITGYMRTGTRKNFLTLIAILGVLPAARFAVNFIMIMMQKDVSSDIVRQTEHLAGKLVHGYELIFTLSEGQMPCDAVVIGNKSIVGFAPRGKQDLVPIFEKHIGKAMAAGGHRGMKAKIFRDEKQYLKRIEMLAGEATDREFDEACMTTVKAITL